MARTAIAPLDELVKLSSKFVTQRQGAWDHSAWLDFVSNVQKKGFEISEQMQSSLGEVVEAMKRFYTSTASTNGIEKAMLRIATDSAEFVKDHKGVWGHADWEAFAQRVGKNTISLSEETTSYLGDILESTKVFYSLAPADTVAKKVSKRATAAPKEKSASSSSTTPKPKQVSGASAAKDDLTAIGGVGPALQKKLNAQGINTYAQIAALSDKEIDRLEKTTIKFPGRIKRDDWIGQAKKLNKGKS